MRGLVPVVVLAAAAALGAVPGPAAAGEPCVGVLVDASRAGGSLRTACARVDARNGLEALRKARFSYRLRPDGLICQISGYPKTCSATTQRYWSYWTRAPGSARWAYSTRGPAAHNPKPGSTEGWVFQDGGRARPPAVRQSRICPALVRPSSSASRAVAGTAKASTTANAPPRTTAATSSPPSTSASAAQPPMSMTAAASAPAAVVRQDDPTPAPQLGGAPDRPEPGRPVGLLVGVALLTSLLVATVARGRRPRPPNIR